jgi:nucleotide-binding universal stress UspA family protein
MLEGPLMADVAGWIGAQPYGAQVQQFRTLLEERGETVVAAYRDQCREAGIESDAVVRLGHPARVILDAEAETELLILGQKGEHAKLIGDMLGSTVERVARHATIPCLVTPSSFQPVTRIVAAYDGSGHGAKALREAAELAVALEVDVRVLTVAEAPTGEEAAEIAEAGRKIAEAHGGRVSSAIAEGDPAEAILATAREHACNLIVVGAYGHARIREMFIGSTTNQLISDADIPVLLVP